MGKSDYHYWTWKENKKGRLGKKRLTEIADMALNEEKPKKNINQLNDLTKGLLGK